MKIKVVIADEHSLMREGLKALFKNEKTIKLVGEAGNDSETAEIVKKVAPNVAIIDANLLKMNDHNIIRNIHNVSSKTKIICLSAFNDERFICNMLETGIRGFVLKNSNFNELVDAIYSTNKGKIYFCKELRDKDYSKFLDNPKLLKRNHISPREREILKLIAEGHGNKQIASQLKISTRTVETYHRNLYNKLNVRNTADLTKIAISEGLINL